MGREMEGTMDAGHPDDVGTARRNEAHPSELTLLETIERRLLWLSAWTIHHANTLREDTDGVKVGGHQASCASMATIMAALYFHALRPQDKVAVKPHGGPLLHAIHYLLGTQSRAQLEAFRAFGGAQSYPSRTKDAIPVDFSTGSVGLGVAITAFASLVQDYLLARGRLEPEAAGRMIALMGDAELDEGNIYECLIEGFKHDLRNCWWIVDYNRQSLDATTADRMFGRFGEIFESCGWRVVTLRHGAMQTAFFRRPGGQALAEWIEGCGNADYAVLTYQGGAAWRARLQADLADQPRTLALIAELDDPALGALMTNLGGHCLETLTSAYDAAAGDERPTLFIAYTIKGRDLPFQGHKDNHAGLMTEAQIGALRDRLNIAEGEEWERLAGVPDALSAPLEALLERQRQAITRPEPRADPVPLPSSFAVPAGAHQSTQVAFGKIMLDIARSDAAFAQRIVTTSPDVTVSTNLGGFVNQRGLFRRSTMSDIFAEMKAQSPQKWAGGGSGHHIELGIAEHNLFLLLAALGLAGPHFGTRLLPVGTVYDPFIARGLDALNYGCYQDARFLLVGTPSGITLGPEGGAHQSIGTPLIGMSQPGLTFFEPAFADELALIMRWALEHLQAEDGGSVYLRLSTRPLDQIARPGDDWQADALKGGTWLRPPAAGSALAIAYAGALAPEALAAYEALADDIPGLGLLAVTSADLLHRGWSAAQASRWTGGGRTSSHVEHLLAPLAPDAQLVTLVDGAPATLSWLGAVRGQRVAALGTDRFGQTGNLADLYREYRLDTDAILDAVAELLA